MALNGYQGQLRAVSQPNQKFLANQQLYDLMLAEANIDVAYVSRIGIQYKQRYPVHFMINDQEFEMGITGIFEASDIKLTSFKFLEDVDHNAIIDFIFEPNI